MDGETGSLLVEVLLAFLVASSAIVAFYQVTVREGQSIARAKSSFEIELAVRNRLALLDAGVSEAAVTDSVAEADDVGIRQEVQQLTGPANGRALFKITFRASLPSGRSTKLLELETLRVLPTPPQ